jgi:hypothetical protein
MKTITAIPETQIGHLIENQTQTHYAAISEFMTSYNVGEIHEYLWNWLEVALGADQTIYDRGDERSNLIYFYKQLYHFIESIYKLTDSQVKDRDE